MIVYGGSCCKGGPYTYYNNVYALDLTTMTWEELDDVGEAPKARSQHGTCLMWNRYMLVVGGYSGDWLTNDIFCLDLKHLWWHRVRLAGDVPAPVNTVPTDFRVEAAQIGCVVLDSDRVLVHGLGGGGLYIFTMSSCTLQKVTTTNTLPDLVAHVICKANSKQMVVFGGCDKNTRETLDTLYRIDLQ